MNKAEEIRALIKDLKAPEVLSLLANQFEREVIFSNSFGWEDQVISLTLGLCPHRPKKMNIKLTHTNN